MYDDKHRFSILEKGIIGSRYGQRGLSEKLLCRACEQRFSAHEKYAADVMQGRLGHRAQIVGNEILIHGVDYAPFKLFQLSILWRASVSTLDFFRLVSLGPREELLRKMLLSDEPGDPNEFGCVVVFIHDQGQDMSDTIFNPEPMRWAGRRIHKIYFAGAVWLYHCDRRRAASHLQKFFLQRNGTLRALFGDLNDGRTFGSAAKAAAKRAGYA